ncbi:acyl-CoA dehydrogenase family protein [Pseudonocardia benzenivorans]
MVDRGTPGLEYEVIDKIGLRTCQNVTMRFDDVRVPEENLFAEGNGDLVVNRAFTWSAPMASAAAVGVARGAYEFALKWAKTYTGGGSSPIIAHQAVGHLLTEIAARIEAGRYMCWKAAHYLDRHDGQGHALAAMNKVYCADLMKDVVVDCMRIVGVNALDRKFGMEKFYREAIVFPLYDAGNLGMQRRKSWGVMADPAFTPDLFADDDPFAFTKSMEGYGVLGGSPADAAHLGSGRPDQDGPAGPSSTEERCMPTDVAATTPATRDARRRRAATLLAWERFVAGDDEPAVATVPAPILRSWRRCRDVHGLDPMRPTGRAQRPAPVAAPRDTGIYAQLGAVAATVVREIGGCLATVTDADAEILACWSAPTWVPTTSTAASSRGRGGRSRWAGRTGWGPPCCSRSPSSSAVRSTGAGTCTSGPVSASRCTTRSPRGRSEPSTSRPAARTSWQVWRPGSPTSWRQPAATSGSGPSTTRGRCPSGSRRRTPAGRAPCSGSTSRGTSSPRATRRAGPSGASRPGTCWTPRCAAG